MPRGVWERGKPKTILICKQCGKEFAVTESVKNRKYCSQECCKISQRKKLELICKQCGEEFETYPSYNQKYCSNKCKVTSTMRRVKVICKTCGREFEVHRWDKNRKYCSQECYRVSEKGRIFSEEWKKKLGEGIKIAWEKRAESSGYPKNYLYPNFNFESIPIFKSLDKILHTKSRYGGTKVGEKKIGRYFVDCFNKKYQFIIEWNEKWHNNNSYYPEEYDANKREYILIKYPDYTYITIRQDRWFKKGNLTTEIADKIVDYILLELKSERKESEKVRELF